MSSIVKNVRNFTLALCGWLGVKRHGEARTVRYGYLSEFAMGIMWNLAFSKTDPTGKGQRSLLPRCDGSPICPVAALKQWLQYRQLQLNRPLVYDDIIFGNLNPADMNEPIKDDTLRKQLLDMFRLCSIVGRDKTSVSLRGGGSDFYKSGASSQAATVSQFQGQWSDTSMVQKVYSKQSEKEYCEAVAAIFQEKEELVKPAKRSRSQLQDQPQSSSALSSEVPAVESPVKKKSFTDPSAEQLISVSSKSVEQNDRFSPPGSPISPVSLPPVLGAQDSNPSLSLGNQRKELKKCDVKQSLASSIFDEEALELENQRESLREQVRLGARSYRNKQGKQDTILDDGASQLVKSTTVMKQVQTSVMKSTTVMRRMKQVPVNAKSTKQAPACAKQVPMKIGRPPKNPK